MILPASRMFATRALLATFKRTTGIVGLPVIHNARAVLTDLYDQTLQNVKVGEMKAEVDAIEDSRRY